MKKISGIVLILLFIAILAGQRSRANLPEKKGENLQEATFAAGCFWCIEGTFEGLDGVHEAISGYTGGHTKNPTYQDVSRGGTGHVEAVRVIYDPREISYSDLLEVYWTQFDPTDDGGSFVDRGSQYRSAIFYHTPRQKALAEASRRKLAESGRFQKPIVTQIRPAETFYPAEEYHQNYFQKNTIQYKNYRRGSGRDQFIEKVWKKQGKGVGEDARLSPAELKKKLTPLQYQVTQAEGTEPPFDNQYWDNHREGIYVDVVSGEPLFSSRDKFESGTGWPSFTRPLEARNIRERVDRKLWVKRVEVRSRLGNSHLGHLFQDGPAPTGLRYCINSAALRFIPKEELKKEGYGQYLELFQPEK